MRAALNSASRQAVRPGSEPLEDAARSSGVNGSGSGGRHLGHWSPAKTSRVTISSTFACWIIARKLPEMMFLTYFTERPRESSSACSPRTSLGLSSPS